MNWFCNDRRSKTSDKDHVELGRFAPYWAVQLAGSLNSLHTKLNRIYEKEQEIMSDLSDAMDVLEANTTANSDAEASAEAAFTRLGQMIADLRNNTTDPAMIARIRTLSDLVASKASSLAAAVVAAPT